MAKRPPRPKQPGPAGGAGVAGFEEGVDAAEHGGGLPQLDAATFPSQIFWLIVSFIALYWLFSRKALPRVGEILEARQTRIASDLDRAAALRAEAEEALRRHEAVVAEAQARAAARIKETQDRLAADATKRQAEVDAELNAKLAEAEARIGSARGPGAGRDPGRRRRGRARGRQAARRDRGRSPGCRGHRGAHREGGRLR